MYNCTSLADCSLTGVLQRSTLLIQTIWRAIIITLEPDRLSPRTMFVSVELRRGIMQALFVHTCKTRASHRVYRDRERKRVRDRQSETEKEIRDQNQMIHKGSASLSHCKLCCLYFNKNASLSVFLLLAFVIFKIHSPCLAPVPLTAWLEYLLADWTCTGAELSVPAPICGCQSYTLEDV